MVFYRDLFPVGSFEDKGVYEEGRYNGVIIEVAHRRRVLRHTVTDDLDKIYDAVGGDNFCLMAPISYIGKDRKSEHARELYALGIDLDGVMTDSGFDFFVRQIEHGDEMLAFVWGLPRPTYVVASGTGMHLYYVFDTPIRLWPNVAKELAKLKKRLTWQAWTQGASDLHDHVQYESLFQGFRMVGSATKVGTRVRAFKTGAKVTVDYLNGFVPEEHQAEMPLWSDTMSISVAMQVWPEWYQRRIVEGRPRGTWTCKRDLYDWWVRQLKAGAEQGHRYWCVMTMAVYARKSGVSYDELAEDAMGLVDFLDAKGDGTDPFTEADVLDALEAYNDSYLTYPIDTIRERTGIWFEKNKRNGRTREAHMKRVNAMIDFDISMGEPDVRYHGGAPTKRDLVRNYAAEHPEANHSQIARALGVSRPTVIKWLRDAPEV